MEKENKIIFGRSKSFFPLIDYPLQYMEMPLPSYSFTYISFEQLFFFFCVIFVSFFQKRITINLFFSQEVDQQNNYMVTGVVPLDSGGEITGRGSGAAGRSWRRIVGDFRSRRQVNKLQCWVPVQSEVTEYNQLWPVQLENRNYSQIQS